MLQHKLNQAKNANFQLKKKKKKNMYTFKCLLFALPAHSQTPRCAHGRTCARVAHAGAFRQTNISLAGVKLSCVHIYTLKTTKTKARLKNNTNGIKIGSNDDVVIIPVHLLIYIYLFIYQKILPRGRSHLCPWSCVFKSHSKVYYKSLGRHQ